MGNGHEGFQYSDPAAATKLYHILTSYIALNMAYTMARLGIADILKEKPLAVDILAGKANVATETMERICRGLVQFELLAERHDGVALTPMGSCLCSDYPGSLRPLAMLAGEQLNPAWGKLPEAARSSTTGFELALGKSLFEYNDPRTNPGTLFHAFMAGISADLASILMQVYDLSGVTSVVDIGGGNGTCIKALLDAYPSCSGLLMESPGVASLARIHCAALVDTGRLSVIEGDFLDAIPTHHDVYLLSQILHDWDDDICIRLLRNCRIAMKEESKLLIITCLLPGGESEPDFAVLSDLNMLVLTGGRERSEQEYAALLQEAGLKIHEVIPARMEYYVIVAGSTS